jgi:hypothetical protein
MTYMKQVFPIFLRPGGGPLAPVGLEIIEEAAEFIPPPVTLLLIDDKRAKALLAVDSFRLV